jgi:hypothetical protein
MLETELLDQFWMVCAEMYKISRPKEMVKGERKGVVVEAG